MVVHVVEVVLALERVGRGLAEDVEGVRQQVAAVRGVADVDRVVERPARRRRSRSHACVHAFFYTGTLNCQLDYGSMLLPVILFQSHPSQVPIGPIPPLRRRVEPALPGWVVDVGSAENARMSDDGGVMFVGNVRAYLADDVALKGKWSEYAYTRVNYFEAPLSLDLDLSNVPCGCLACVYLVALPQPNGDSSSYCDMAHSFQPGFGGGPCTEVDIMEADNVAFSSALHTSRGSGSDGGRCNSWGCSAFLGPMAKSAADRRVFGPGDGFAINSQRKFNVRIARDSEAPHGAYTIRLEQDGRHATVFNHRKAGNPAGRGLPLDALRGVQQSMGKFALVASLWSQGAPANEWLDGECMKCDLGAASFTVSNLDFGHRWPPPSRPPHPPIPPPWRGYCLWRGTCPRPPPTQPPDPTAPPTLPPPPSPPLPPKPPQVPPPRAPPPRPPAPPRTPHPPNSSVSWLMRTQQQAQPAQAKHDEGGAPPRLAPSTAVLSGLAALCSGLVVLLSAGLCWYTYSSYTYCSRWWHRRLIEQGKASEGVRQARRLHS